MENRFLCVNINGIFISFLFSCRFSPCNPYVCGLHFFTNNGDDSERFEDLKQKISVLRNKGAFVKLSVGGQEWGNTVLSIKVSRKNNICAVWLAYFRKNIGIPN